MQLGGGIAVYLFTPQLTALIGDFPFSRKTPSFSTFSLLRFGIHFLSFIVFFCAYVTVMKKTALGYSVLLSKLYFYA